MFCLFKNSKGKQTLHHCGEFIVIFSKVMISHVLGEKSTDKCCEISTEMAPVDHGKYNTSVTSKIRWYRK